MSNSKLTYLWGLDIKNKKQKISFLHFSRIIEYIFNFGERIESGEQDVNSLFPIHFIKNN